MTSNVMTVTFNTDEVDEKELHNKIKSGGFNFSGETKKMWAEKLNVNYVDKKRGSKGKVKVNHEND